MLRSTRPLWASSTRALLSQNAATVTSRRQASQLTTAKSRTCNALSTSRILPLTHRTSYATKHLQDKENPEEVKKWGEQKLESHPETVSGESSVRHFSDFLEPSQKPANKDDPAAAPPVKDGVAHDLNLVKETFSLSTVPKESLTLGLAGTLPYLATSFSNVYLSWVLNTEWPTSSNFLNSILMSHDNARYWLGVVEPLQMGYGAVIISFLGAIHWGLEYAEKKPSKPRTQFRYGMGVAASVLAWPTLFMPWQFALTSQFAAFVGLYFADSRAAVRGWAPYWYGTYRFVLTAIVGAAIMISIIGRSKIGDTAPRLSGLGEKFHATHGEEQYSNEWAKAEAPAKKEYKKKKEEEEKRKQEEEKRKQEEEAKKQKEEEAKKQKEEKEKAQKEAKKSKDEGKKEDKADKKEDKPDKKEDKPEDQGKANEKKDDKADKGEEKPKEEKPKDGKKNKDGDED